MHLLGVRDNELVLGSHCSLLIPTTKLKKSFSERLENLRQALTPGSKDNLGLITKLMDIAEAHCRGHPQEESHIETESTCSSTFLKSAGK